MREIYVNGVAFRYKSERDLELILRHARKPARLMFLSELCRDVATRRKTLQKIIDMEREAPVSTLSPFRPTLSAPLRQRLGNDDLTGI